MFHIECYKTEDEAQKHLEQVARMTDIWHIICICKKPMEHDGRYWITWAENV